MVGTKRDNSADPQPTQSTSSSAGEETQVPPRNHAQFPAETFHCIGQFLKWPSPCGLSLEDATYSRQQHHPALRASVTTGWISFSWSPSSPPSQVLT